jgi:NarL family two-component system sensor histidine kinase YdfH
MSNASGAASHRPSDMSQESSATRRAPSALGRLGRIIFPVASDKYEGLREVRPFYLIMLVVLVVMYIQAIYAEPGIRVPATLLLFTGLMLVHIYLHWYSFYVTLHQRLRLPYLVVQGGLAFGMVTLAHNNPGLAFGLYFALIGESIGVVQDRRLTILVVAAYLGLALYSFVPLLGWRGVAQGALIVAPVTIFVTIYVVMYQRQIEARYRIQSLLSELEVAHKQLAEYAVRIEDLTLAAERQRMARELHDTLAQGLAGLILQLEAATSHLADQHTDRTAAILEQAMLRARQTLAEARRAIDDLRSERPASGDLSAAIHHEARRFTDATGISCTLTLDELNGLSETICQHVERIVAEGLANVALHAQASAVTLSAHHADGHIELALADDGIGFDASPGTAQKGHYGLIGMRERARLIGGNLSIESASGAGTILRLRI